MIPARIRLSNFLTFGTGPGAEPVELDFEGVSLWSIAGVNGAGKSAVFDAINYALYGEHRGGRQHDGRLVRKGTKTAKVDFEFLQAGVRYRIERSITLKVGRQGQPRGDDKHVQASTWDDAEEVWVPIPDTDRSTELEQWVRRTLGMGADTFRSSVLLRQGEADKLLNVRASARLDILAGLIDLGAYKTLETMATQRRRSQEAKVDNLETQLREIEDVSTEAVEAAAKLLKEASNQVRTAEQKQRQQERRLDGARNFERLSGQQRRLAESKAALHEIVAEAADIRSRAERYHVLEQMINPVSQALLNLTAADKADAAFVLATDQASGIDLDDLEATAKQLESDSQELDSELQSAQERDGHLQLVFGYASSVRRCRNDLLEREQNLREFGDPAHLDQRGKELAEQLDAIKNERDALAGHIRQQINSRGRTQNRLEQAEQRLSSLSDLAVGAKCSRCGQPVTQEHLEAERHEATSEVHEATSQLAAVNDEIAKIGKQDSTLEETLDAVTVQQKVVLSTAQDAATAAGEVQRARTLLADEIDRAPGVDPSWVPTDTIEQILTGGLPQAAEAYTRLETETKTARHIVQQVRPRTLRAQTAAKNARTVHTSAQLRVTKLKGEAQRQTSLAEESRRQAEAWLKSVAPELATAVNGRREDVLLELREELGTLSDAKDKLAKLEHAESELRRVSTTLEVLAAELEAIIVEHRVSVQDADADLEAAKEALTEAAGRRDLSRDEHVRLKEALKSRQLIVASLTEARTRASTAKQLASLLGKSELQGRLVADATSGVEAYANDTLSRISGGTLTLSLRHDQSTSLDIFVEDRSSATDPLEVAFISGSQKFRVAVALAAGLGQYIGGRTAIRSLIIDEGFGSLDSDGRQHMIEELHALSEILDRVIVVSHQEDFADRTLFPNSYVLRKDGTQTTVEHVG